ncbi:MAG TPA: VanZ family protein [Vicinamibacterales bacterium]|nr:VanZ family protein [Vicinamibacterales bacterium]
MPSYHLKVALACIVSAAVVLISPFMGQLQSYLRRSLTTTQYVWLFGTAVSAAIAMAMFFAYVRIRERRRQRLALMAAAVALGGGYMWLTATPYAEVNAVERVHFVEYGMIAWLFYRARLQHQRGVAGEANDGSLILVPLLLAFMVGTLDEWLQWFIPVRVGEAHDVFLNLAAIACGLMFAFALQPPDSFAWRLHQRTLRQTGVVAAVVWLVFAAFVSQVHLGYEHDVPGVGRFRSHYTLDELIALQKERRHRWDAEPPRTLRRLSQEDQYLDEGVWHVRRRNLTGGIEAWHENLILERYYAPVIDIPTYASPDRNRWSLEQRENMATSIGQPSSTFTSTAEPYPIVTWSKRSFWSAAIAIAIALCGLPWLSASRR